MRYLTKSRFKLGLQCPTKLFYTKKKEYLDTKLDDPFLEALAEGGYQVGELAKFYHPGGHDITSLEYEEAEKQTNDLLKQDKVIIYEPAIKFKNLFVRIDILIKNISSFDLIEVKAKSWGDPDDKFLNKNGSISSEWTEYLYDIAFQKHVLHSAFPTSKINAYLMLTDKSKTCDVDGLNQKFQIVRDEKNRKGIRVSSNLTKEDLKKEILVKVPIDEIIDPTIISEEFLKMVKTFSDAYEQDKKIISPLSKSCADCEFMCSSEDEKKGFKNGFKECWKLQIKWQDSDFKDEHIFEIWNSRKKDKYIAAEKYKIIDLEKSDIEPKPDKKLGMSPSERQWLQVEKVQKKDKTPEFDKEGIKNEMKKWVFPLHFIDFETSMVAIPFNKGRRPYEGIAFQFSHHIVQKDGSIEHLGEYLNVTPGIFPNYEFLREFKRQLEKDNGTIFRYSSHENTYLNHIYKQLKDDTSKISDRTELMFFIQSITSATESTGEDWEGDRIMVDLWQLVKRYYYDPHTHGSNSIKAILPAILNSSKFLQDKYSKPIYGSKNGIKSLNFKDWTWLEKKNGEVVDPYKKLPKLFTDISERNYEIISYESELSNGGAALTAYAKMQFTEMHEEERKELSNALLRYCELDTMAMVMIYEAWKDWVQE